MSQKNGQAGTEELRQFISFSVGEEDYGLELLRVKEVIRVREITWIPRVPSFVRGIVNLRGDVIPVIDLRQRFGLAPREHSTTTRVIVVEVDGRLVGMIVDSASQAVRIPAADIEPPPPALGGLMQGYIAGIGKVEERLIVLLNIDSVLTVEERSVLGTLELGEPAA